MGTRSLLAVETSKDKYHVQYMQFDGYPESKGYQYYKALLLATQFHLVTKAGKPNKHMRKRAINYLNEIQYQTGHSIGNNYEVKAADWKKQDSWQEWQYLFDYNGDFKFFHTYSESNGWTYVIPWEMTHKMAMIFREDLTSEFSGQPPLEVFFKENAWTGFDEDEDAGDLLRLKLSTGELLAFPEQGDNGWRNFATLYAIDDKMKEKIICESSFVNSHGSGTNIRNLKHIISTIEKEKVPVSA